jgi:glutaredoxin
MSLVKAQTDAHSLVVFSSSWCPYCKQVIQALEDADLDAHVVEVDDATKAELQGLTGKSSVPSVWIGEKYIGGCNDGPESWMGTIPNIRKGKVQRWVKDLEKARGGAAPAPSEIFGGSPASAPAATESLEVSIQWCGG